VRRNRLMNPLRIIAGMLSAMLLAILALPLGAQVASESYIGRGFAPAYDVAHETTLVGTIQEVVTEHVAGPAGMHLLVASLQGVVDVHVGPFLSLQTREALHTGVRVQIVGATVQLEDKEYLLARELGAGAHTVTIRNRRGFLVYPHADRIMKNDATAQAGRDGVAR